MIKKKIRMSSMFVHVLEYKKKEGILNRIWSMVVKLLESSKDFNLEADPMLFTF